MNIANWIRIMFEILQCIFDVDVLRVPIPHLFLIKILLLCLGASSWFL